MVIFVTVIECNANVISFLSLENNIALFLLYFIDSARDLNSNLTEEFWTKTESKPVELD